jgi:hypothetical protein
MKYYRDKELLVIPFNTGNHWVTLAIFTKYDQFWYFNTGNHWVTLAISTKYDRYCDSSRSTDLITGNRLIRDWTDVMVVLNK